MRLKHHHIWSGAILFSISFAVANPVSAVVINLTNDGVYTDAPSFGTTKIGPLNDPFAYNPAAPASALPQQVYTGHAPELWHSTDGDITTQYAVLFDAVYNNIFIDFYARTDDPSAHNRDDNLYFHFYNGSWDLGDLAHIEPGVSINNSGTGHNRITISSAVEADRVRIYNSSYTNWSIAELRANGTLVPEPATLAMLGIGGLLIARRRR